MPDILSHWQRTHLLGETVAALLDSRGYLIEERAGKARYTDSPIYAESAGGVRFCVAGGKKRGCRHSGFPNGKPR